MIYPDVPYYCQWESANLAQDIILGKTTPMNDSLWKNSGASTQTEYVKWSSHICGMTCLKMLLEKFTGKTIPVMTLVQQAARYGAYVEKDGYIHGLIYAPFVKYLAQEHGLSGRIEVDINTKNIPRLVKDNSFFMASVHPSIRWADRQPPKKGGHLVLVIAASDGHVVFHNPSGHMPDTRKNVVMPFDVFDRFFAGRGILIEKPV